MKVYHYTPYWDIVQETGLLPSRMTDHEFDTLMIQGLDMPRDVIWALPDILEPLDCLSMLIMLAYNHMSFDIDLLELDVMDDMRAHLACRTNDDDDYYKLKYINRVGRCKFTTPLELIISPVGVDKITHIKNFDLLDLTNVELLRQPLEEVA